MKITVTNGIGREVNPYHCENEPKYNCYQQPDSYICQGCHDVAEFEHTHPGFAAFTTDGRISPDGEYDAEVAWQGRTVISEANKSNWFLLTYNSDAMTPDEWAHQGFDVRTIYIITKPREKLIYSKAEVGRLVNPVEERICELETLLAIHEKRNEIIKYIFDIYWMGTKEFCEAYGVLLPIPLPDTKAAAEQFIFVDCMRWKKTIDKAKEIARANPLPKP